MYRASSERRDADAGQVAKYRTMYEESVDAMSSQLLGRSQPERASVGRARNIHRGKSQRNATA
jgi:hypothetical protein